MGKYTTTVEDQLVLPARVLQTRGQQQLFRLTGQPVPASVPVRFLVDTGSRRSTLVPGVIHHLCPAPGSDVRVETGLAIGEATLFWVRLEFPDASLAPIAQVAVARLNLPPSLGTFHGLIGRDVLRRWDSLVYEGRRGRFSVRDTAGGLRGWFRGWTKRGAET